MNYRDADAYALQGFVVSRGARGAPRPRARDDDEPRPRERERERERERSRERERGGRADEPPEDALLASDSDNEATVREALADPDFEEFNEDTRYRTHAPSDGTLASRKISPDEVGLLAKRVDSHRNDLLAEWKRMIPEIEDTYELDRDRRRVMKLLFGRPPYYFLQNQHVHVPIWTRGHGSDVALAMTRHPSRIAPHFYGCFRSDYSEQLGARPSGYYTFMRVMHMARDDVAREFVEMYTRENPHTHAAARLVFFYTRFVRRRAMRENFEMLTTGFVDDPSVIVTRERNMRAGVAHTYDEIRVGDDLVVESHVENDAELFYNINVLVARAGREQERYIIGTIIPLDERDVYGTQRVRTHDLAAPRASARM